MSGASPNSDQKFDVTPGEHTTSTLAYRSSEGSDQRGALVQLRRKLKEPAGEFLGTMILVMFGTAANCQTTLLSDGKSAKGDWLSGIVGWSFGIALGVWIASKVSEGHINPAVTLAQAIFRRFSWRKVPLYWIAQLTGAFFGAYITYGIYWNAIDAFEGKGIRTVPGTAGLFGTFPLPYVTNAVAFFNEFLATALLVLTVFVATDKHEAVPTGLVPLVIFLGMAGISTVFGAQTSFAMNPARDLGPRMMSAIYYGRDVFNYRHQYWIWGPIIADFTGAIAGAFVYDAFIYGGNNSLIAVPREEEDRERRPTKTEADQIV